MSVIVKDRSGKLITLEEHEDTGWIDLTSICKYRKINGIVYVWIYSRGNVKLDKNDNRIGILPIEVRPKFEIIMPIQLMGIAMETNHLIHSRIKQSGEISVYLPIETEYIEGFASYPLE